MTVQIKPLADVTRKAIEVLTRELGPADTLRFVNQFTTGFGDYTTERAHLFGEVPLEQIIKAIKAKTTSRPGEPAPAKKAKTSAKRNKTSRGTK